MCNWPRIVIILSVVLTMHHMRSDVTDKISLLLITICCQIARLTSNHSREMKFFLLFVAQATASCQQVFIALEIPSRDHKKWNLINVWQALDP